MITSQASTFSGSPKASNLDSARLMTISIHNANIDRVNILRAALYDIEPAQLQRQLNEVFATDCEIHLASPFQDLDRPAELVERAFLPLIARYGCFQAPVYAMRPGVVIDSVYLPKASATRSPSSTTTGPACATRTWTRSWSRREIASCAASRSGRSGKARRTSNRRIFTWICRAPELMPGPEPISTRRPKLPSASLTR